MNEFEKQRIANIVKRNKHIQRVINGAMTDIAKRFKTVKGKRFAKVIDKRLAELHDRITADITTEIQNNWMLANKMNNAKIDGYRASVQVSEGLRQSWRTPNLKALNSFIDRTEKGLNLSRRIWNITDSIQEEINDLVAQGVLTGKSARAVSRDLIKYESGKSILYAGTLIKGTNNSYKSIRLAATEINMAFRAADYMQNQDLPFVTGQTIHLSPAHPAPDICNPMAGPYPKEFRFVGWHPFCICFVTWNTMSKESFVKYIKTGKISQKSFIKKIPNSAQKYLDANRTRILKYKNQPYWMRDNFTKNMKFTRKTTGARVLVGYTE